MHHLHHVGRFVTDCASVGFNEHVTGGHGHFYLYDMTWIGLYITPHFSISSLDATSAVLYVK